MMKFDLNLELLKALDTRSSVMLAEATVFNQVRIVMTPVPSLLELKGALRDLEARGFVEGVADRLNPDVMKWRLTDAGRAEVLSRA